MSMTFSAVLRGTDGVWSTVPGSPEVNLSNSNAFAVLGALGLEPDYCGGSLPVPEWAQRARRFKEALRQGRGAEFCGAPDRSVRELELALGAKVIDFTIDAEGIEERLRRLIPVYRFAQVNEADIGWS